MPRRRILRSALAALPLAGLSGAAYAGTIGQWSGVVDWPRIPIHAMIMPDGRLMTFGVKQDNSHGAFDYDLWDPKRGTGLDSHLSFPSMIAMDAFCAAQLLQPWNGVAMTAGGNSSAGSATYDGQTLSTKLINSTRYPRWYATMTTMPDGRLAIQGGMVPYDFNAHTVTPELFTPGQGWSELAGARSTEAYGTVHADGRANYVHSWPVSTTKLFTIAGQRMFYLDVAGNGTISGMQPFNRPNWGATSSAVMYRPGKILQVGGGSPANNVVATDGSKAATIIDINGPAPVIQETGWMAFGRHWLNATVLPNGEVLVTGGSAGDNEARGVVYAAEIWNPNSGAWRTDASQKKMRLYHSTALLLPDGRVFSGGGGSPGPVANRDAEFYSPSYLFDAQNRPAARPVITEAPGLIRPGQSFSVTANGGNGVARVTLVKTGANTHGWDNDQRFIELSFRQNGATLNVNAPQNYVEATPGYYMLFVLDQSGVPSEAKIVKVPVPVGDEGVAPGSRPSVNWTAAVGTSNRDYWTVKCQDGEVLAGLYGTAGARVGDLGGRCVTAVGGRWSANPRSFGRGGSDAQPAFVRDCPRDQVVSAIGGQANGFATQLTVTCSPMNKINGAASGGSKLAAIGNGGGATYPDSPCAVNGSAYGIYGGSDGAGSRVGMLCRNGGGDTVSAGTPSTPTPTPTTPTTPTTPVAGTNVPAQPATAVSIESASNPGFYVRRLHGDAMSVAQVGTAIDKLETSFQFVPGLNGQGVAFQSVREPNRYLRHAGFVLYNNRRQDIALPADASFTRRVALAGACGCSSGPCVSYESTNYQNHFIRVRADASLGIDAVQDSTAYRQQASFCERPTLTGSDSASVLRVSHSGMCLSVQAGAGDGGPVTQQACTGRQEQSWTLKASGGSYTIVNGASGKCLDVWGVAQNDGAKIVQWACHGGPNQAWTMKAQGAGSSFTSLNSNKCLDVFGASVQPGAATIQWACHGGANQTFVTSNVQPGL